MLFQIPPTVFYPQPKVQSALVRVTFKHHNASANTTTTGFRGHEVLGGAHPMLFRKVITSSWPMALYITLTGRSLLQIKRQVLSAAFQQRRKMLRQSLRVKWNACALSLDFVCV